MKQTSQKQRLRDADRCRLFFDELALQVRNGSTVSQAQILTVEEIVRNVRDGVSGRLGKRERDLVKAGDILFALVREKKAQRAGVDTLGDWSIALGTWTVISEGLRPVNRQALRDVLSYRRIDR